MIQRRFTVAKLRAKGGDKPGIEGYGAVFNQEYVMYDSPTLRIVERVKPGTFKKAIQEKQDVRCLFNHDPNNLLGSTGSGTMRISEDSKGLAFSTDLDMRTRVGSDVSNFVDRGDLKGCSFSFVVTKQTRTEMEEGDKLTINRDIEDVDLFDVGPVTFPAYEGTSVGGRSISRMELRSLFPDGIPSNVLARAPEFRGVDGVPDQPSGNISDAPTDDPEESDVSDGDSPDATPQTEPDECECNCRACYSAECNECDMHMQDCGDSERCGAGMRSGRAKRDDNKKTKRVDGEDLPASSFLYVGDPDKTATWSLPWKFSTDEKTKSHLRNALARFSQTNNIPSDKKAGVWKKLVAKCKQYGIHVTDESSSEEKSSDIVGIEEAKRRSWALAASK